MTTETLEALEAAHLSTVRARMGIVVTAHDAEISSLIGSAVLDMIRAGVPESVFTVEDLDPLVLLAVVYYVRSYFGDDRTDTDKNMGLYRRIQWKLQTEDGGAWDVEDNSDDSGNQDG